MSALTVDFRSFIPAAGSLDGARVLFQRLIIALMRVHHKDAAGIRPKTGDGGIDCFVGSLSGGSVIIWQAKYFIDGIGASQKDQIRQSFRSAVAASDKDHYRIVSWTLCVPCQLSMDERKWWDGWKKKQQHEHGIRIDLYDEDVLRELLMTRDAQYLLHGVFGAKRTWLQYFVDAMVSGKQERDIVDLPDPSVFDQAVFVRQLNAAGVVEKNSAKRAFFNAELLTQEILNRGDNGEIRELENIKAKVYSLWETRFNAYLYEPTLPAMFYGCVMEAIEEQSDKNLCSSLTAATFVHKQGVGHQLADRCEIGWIRNFREVFSHVRSESA